MKKVLSFILAAVMVCTMNSFCLTGFAYVAEGEAIVVLKSSADSGYMNASKAASLYGNGVKLESKYTFTGKSSANKTNVAYLTSNSKTTEALVKSLKKNPAVKYAFANSKKHITSLTNDEYEKYQWALENSGQNGGTPNLDVEADGLYESAAASPKEQIVAVADTGLDLTHPEFENIVWENKHLSKLRGKHGLNLITGGSPQDDNGHGTHCAGIIAAAANNNIGISGINQSNVKIMPLKWLDSDGSGYNADVIACYDYINRAKDLGENVVAINNSWGGYAEEDEMKAFKEIFDRLGEKGIISLVAAGNDGLELKTEEFDGYYLCPAMCGSKYQITVGASNEKDELASFSNYSGEYVDVAAPGVNILSTVSSDTFNPVIYSDEKKAQLVYAMQDYESAVSPGNMGAPSIVPVTKEQAASLNDNAFSTNVEFNYSAEKFYGLSGKALSVKLKDGYVRVKDVDSDILYCVELPYSVENCDENYSIAFDYTCNDETEMLLCDVPADTDVAEKLNNTVKKHSIDILASEKGANYWRHKFYNIDVSEDSFKESNDRKLVFIIYSVYKDTEFIIDNFAVSKSGLDTAEFGRYDFYNGTSMATPYVAGAAALLFNAYPDSNIADVINMLTNTGRVVEGYAGKIRTSRELSLDNTDKTPPLIFGAGYNKDGNVSINGSFKDVTSVKINGEEVTPVKSDKHEIIVADDNYSTNKITVEIANAYGTDTYECVITNKQKISVTDKVEGMPSDTMSGEMITMGDNACFISGAGTVGIITPTGDGTYYYDEDVPQYDTENMFKPSGDINVVMAVSSAYCNGVLYTAFVKVVYSSNGIAIGYDSALASLDLVSGETAKLCELPEDAFLLASLGAYNGSLYLIGGCDENSLTDSVYLYNASKKCFEKQSASLPEKRAGATFLQYGNKLYGFYGLNESGKLPSLLVFDGKQWTMTDLGIESDDGSPYFVGENVYNAYWGNVGYGKNGLLFNGAFIYGLGDTYELDVSKNALVETDYITNSDKDSTELIGTTLPGCFIGFSIGDGEIDNNEASVGRIKGSVKGDGETESGEPTSFAVVGAPQWYMFNTKTAYSTVDSSAVKNARVEASKTCSVYGNNVTVNVYPDGGYELVKFTVNGVAATGEKTVRALTPSIKIEAVVKQLPVEEEEPAPVTPKEPVIKLKGKSKKKRVTLKWNKIKGAKGYQIQRYRKGKWKTIKTIKKGSTVKFKTKRFKKKCTAKYRIRYYKTKNGKRVNSKWSKVIKVKVK